MVWKPKLEGVFLKNKTGWCYITEFDVILVIKIKKVYNFLNNLKNIKESKIRRKVRCRYKLLRE